jgi:hypothetical protein
VPLGRLPRATQKDRVVLNVLNLGDRKDEFVPAPSMTLSHDQMGDLTGLQVNQESPDLAHAPIARQNA